MKSTTLDRVELALARLVYLGTVALQLTVFFALIELAPDQMWGRIALKSYFTPSHL
jgi:hypothetical protein